MHHLRHILYSFAVMLLCVTSGCQTSVRKRPVGYYKLGKVAELATEKEHYFKDFSLLLRRDEAGLSIMSTMCTHDLTALERKITGSEEIFVSNYSESKYDQYGSIISGPAVADLPYYELKIDEGEFGGPLDTLYVQVGVEKPKNWRLPVPVVPDVQATPTSAPQ